MASGVRIEQIRQLRVYEPTVERQACSPMPGARARYWVNGGSDAEVAANHFPIIVGPDGTPWWEANRYLLSRLDGVVPVSSRTLECLAGDLAHFRRWLLAEGVDYLGDFKRPMRRPTYRYCRHLHDEIAEGILQPSTAKRRMSSIQGFYVWAQVDGRNFEYPLWVEQEVSQRFADARGFLKTKMIRSTDLTRSFKSRRGSYEYSEYIEDGGKLRPLLKSEQAALVMALKEIGNPEMTLAFLLALTTGARIQTVFTLRRHNFADEPRQNSDFVRIKVGQGTLVDTKFGKQMVLLVPTWLYLRIKVYMASERCCVRRNRSIHTFDNDGNQYAFLSRSGSPYVISRSDPFLHMYSVPPRGNSVTQFIRQQLKVALVRKGHDFGFRFHDLRATFGVNLLEASLKKKASNGSPNSDPIVMDALMRIRERMGHSSLATTERYLRHAGKAEGAFEVQKEFEKYLDGFMGNEGK